MGYVVSYLAVRGKMPEVVFSELGVTPTGKREEVPEAPLLAARLPGDWLLLFCNQAGHRFIREPALERLSNAGEVVACEVNEREASSAMSAWSGGREGWALRFDSATDGGSLHTRGELPREVTSLLERLHEEQSLDPATAIFFDAPVEAFRAITGFRYDQDIAGAETRPFEVLDERGPREGMLGLKLTVEDEPDREAPGLESIRTAVDRMTPRGGPSFLVLEGRGEDYAQVAGGDGVYTAEWREYTGENFRHWVAGLPGVRGFGMVAIPTNGYRVTVRKNERLSAGHVKEILTAFAEGSPRPAEFAWRDISQRFTKSGQSE